MTLLGLIVGETGAGVWMDMALKARAISSASPDKVLGLGLNTAASARSAALMAVVRELAASMSKLCRWRTSGISSPEAESEYAPAGYSSARSERPLDDMYRCACWERR